MFKYDIRKRRLDLGLTLEEVGTAVGVGKSTVRKWETGDIENMRTDKIAKLCKVLKITPEAFMGWDELPKTVRLTTSEQRLLNAYTMLKESADPKDRAAADAIERLLGLSE